MSEEQKVIAPPPFQFGDVLDAFTLDEKYCYDNKVFAWLRENAGKKHKEWLTKVPMKNGSYLGYCISIRIQDPAVDMQFRLIHAENEVKVIRNEKGYLTHVPRR